MDNVIRWGYEPVVAEGTGDALIRNAFDLASTHCCQIALIDKRSRDDHDRKDLTGIDLIRQVKKEKLPTNTILITGYADHESTEAAHQAGAMAVVRKQSPESLRTALQQAADRWHPTIDIRWPSGWSAKRVANLLVENGACTSAYCEDEADHVIARLFPDAKKVVLKRLNGSTKSDSSVRIRPFRLGSLVFIAYEDDKVPVIVKLLSNRKTIKEKSNYGNYQAM